VVGIEVRGENGEGFGVSRRKDMRYKTVVFGDLAIF
jgi:hypothetical protein